MLNKGVYFISGIDTDAGKSYATGLLAKALAEQGNSVMTQKFIQTGGVGSQGVSIDIELHRKIMGIDILDIDHSGLTAPVIFSYPASPHLASQIDGQEIDFGAIKNSIDTLSSQYDILLVEGAGGLHVPLKDFYTTLDYIQENKLPLVFVTSGKLGSINHTLLSFEVCRQRGIDIALVIYNHHFSSADLVISNDTLSYFKRYVDIYLPETKFLEIYDCDL